MFAIAIAGYPLLSEYIINHQLWALLDSHSQHISKLSSYKMDSPHETSGTDYKNQENKIPGILVASLLILTIVSGIVALGSLFIIFPGVVLDDFPIHRPYEIPPLALL